MHFTYSDCSGKETAHSDLLQGDILEKTQRLSQILEDVHPYYNRNEANRYFIILTQSCDLVRGRSHSGQCKARYISLAPVRPVSVVLDRLIEDEKRGVLSRDVPVCAEKSRTRIQQLLERLLNNNESDYFYLHKEPTRQLPENCCAFLRLPVALRAEEHYETCLAARFLGLSEPFRAKLGWLVGQLFSRVGTQDWDKKEQRDAIRQMMDSTAIWVDDKKVAELETRVKVWTLANPGSRIDADVIGELLDQIPNRKQRVIDRLREIISSSNGYHPEDGSLSLSREQVENFLRSIRNDQTISTLLR